MKEKPTNDKKTSKERKARRRKKEEGPDISGIERFGRVAASLLRRERAEKKARSTELRAVKHRVGVLAKQERRLARLAGSHPHYFQYSHSTVMERLNHAQGRKAQILNQNRLQEERDNQDFKEDLQEGSRREPFSKGEEVAQEVS